MLITQFSVKDTIAIFRLAPFRAGGAAKRRNVRANYVKTTEREKTDSMLTKQHPARAVVPRLIFATFAEVEKHRD